jgi:predicted flavoprotein YhiN
MKKVIVIGGGPAGLMAADVLSKAGVSVHLFDAMPSVGRKFLLAGKGGLNLTHSEPAEIFSSRYGARRAHIDALLNELDATGVREWAGTLGVNTFVGSSGRVFPVDMKAAPLLRAWLHRLRHPTGEGCSGSEVVFHMRHRWTGWSHVHSVKKGVDDGLCLSFDTPQGPVQAEADAVVLAMGGGSWSRLGSDGAWVPGLQASGVRVAPLLPSNCGFDVATRARTQAPNRAAVNQGVSELDGIGWSEHFSGRFAGQPFKSVSIQFETSQGASFQRRGEFVATATGVEGSLIYAASSLLRDEIIGQGRATLRLDLLPDMSIERVLAEVIHPRGARSLSSHLKSRLHIDGIKSAILYELLTKEQMSDPRQLASAIKALPIVLTGVRPIDEAISTAGGVMFEDMDSNLMLHKLPSVFCAGEMLDWEAPTGGYLLTACLASGQRAGRGVLAYLSKQ